MNNGRTLSLGTILTAAAIIIFSFVTAGSAWSFAETQSHRERLIKVEAQLQQLQEFRAENKEEHKEIRAKIEELLKAARTDKRIAEVNGR